MDGPQQSAIQLLRTLETPIKGQPSVIVVNRSVALKMIEVAMRTIWEASEARVGQQ